MGFVYRTTVYMYLHVHMYLRYIYIHVYMYIHVHMYLCYMYMCTVEVYYHTCVHTHTHCLLICRKRFRSKHAGHYKDHSYITSGEFSLDPIRDYSLLEQDEDGEYQIMCVCVFVRMYSLTVFSLSLLCRARVGGWSQSHPQWSQ